MKIIFEADNAADLIALVRAFQPEPAPSLEIDDESKSTLAHLSRGLRRIAHRVENLDAAYPPAPDTPISTSV